MEMPLKCNFFEDDNILSTLLSFSNVFHDPEPLFIYIQYFHSGFTSAFYNNFLNISLGTFT